jgi:thiol:disulfide interchange protein/DsbC/DsbD-like thiol-disulfide interchange protein
MIATRLRGRILPGGLRPPVIALAAAIVLSAGLAAPIEARADPKVRVELVSESAAIQPGGSIWVGLRQRIRPGWHTYWINPGDSGEPATIDWTLPAGFQASPIEWPHPERIPVGPAMSFGYSGEVVLLTRIDAPPDLEPGARATLAGQASWLVCEKICIPEEARVALTLPVTAETPPPDPRGAALIARARRAVPTPSPWPASFSTTPEGLALTIAARGLASERIADAWFYPAQWGAIEYAAPQAVRVDEGGLTLHLARGPLPEATASPIEGVLVIAERLDGRTARHAFTIRATPPRSPAEPAAAGSTTLSFFGAMALALAGGLVLNLMPCVLPVLSVKALSLVEHSGAGLRRHGLAYTAGVLISFAAVACSLLALRAGGEQIGWGFQLQSPPFVTLLAYLLFALALSLSGVVVIGGRLAGTGHALASRPGYTGSFFTGALATVAATPCTAPFMGVAVGFAVTQPWPVALAVFEALGLGLALPYLALTLVPAWRGFLPRPGRWMERLEQFLAFPLYGSVAWLVWVVSQQAGPQGVAVVGAGLVLIGFAAWLHAASRGASARWRRTAATVASLALLAAIGLGGAAGGVSSPSAPAAKRPAGELVSETFSPRRLAELRGRGVPVFVNFTAAWCITCLVNERVALRSPEVAAAFARKGVVYLKADWTRRDAEIAAVLASFGRNGVPLYVLYSRGAAGGEPTVLPQILSEGTIIEAVEKL